MAVINTGGGGGGFFENFIPMAASVAFPAAAPWIQATNAARMGLQGNWAGAGRQALGAAAGTDAFRALFGRMPNVQAGMADSFAPSLLSNQGVWRQNPYVGGAAESIPMMWNAPNPYDLVRRR